MTLVKICGLRTHEAMQAAILGNADFVGLVFYPPSPRFVELADAARLARAVPQHIKIVGLFVDPSDAQIEEALKTVRIDMIQLHGEESPARVASIRALSGRAVMKAIRVGAAADLLPLTDYASVADWLLFDSKPRGASLPGGTGARFDWSLLGGIKPRVPWMLSGGLNAENIAQALASLRPDAVDLSSGLETAPGVKSPEMILNFLKQVKNTR